MIGPLQQEWQAEQLASWSEPSLAPMATEVSQLIEEGVARLRASPTTRGTKPKSCSARRWASHARWLLAHPDERILDCDATDRYEAHVTRRSHGEPVAYVLGEKEFWSLPLVVTPDVLIPRPETELVVELALAHLPADTAARVLDLATGSGAIALAIAHERPRPRVIGTDVVRRGDRRWRGAMPCDCGSATSSSASATGSSRWPAERYDLIVSNPPYIAADDPRVEPDVRRFEPHGALFSGADGLDALRAIAAGAGATCAGGWLIVEHGDRQGPAVRDLFAAAGFSDVATHRDLAGLERCTAGRWPGRPGA